MKRIVTTFVVLLAAWLLTPYKASVVSAQVALDSYGGVTAVPCTNPNGIKYFGKATVASHLVLCDPSGHPFFGRGFYMFDPSGLGNDESGHDYNYYVTQKYGATNTAYTWDTSEVTRFKTWGFNMIGPESTTYALAPWPWQNGGTNPNKVPFLYIEEGCAYSWRNAGGWGTAPVKDLMGVRSSYWTGYVPSGGVTDYEDPAWTTFVNGEAGPSGDSALQVLVNANATDKSYLIGLTYCDADYTHGFEAGPDFDTQPLPGYNDWRLSWMAALASPVEWASTRQSQIYADPTVYAKKTLHDQLKGEFATVSALNAAWGSNYSSFETSGTCFGSHFPSWLCPSPNAATSVGTGNGSTLSFNTALSTTVSQNSVGIYVAGVLVGGDNGSGTIYGPYLSGTVNVSTGALTLSFPSGYAPASGAAITAEYITNGWGIGSGFMDEDGRPSHQSWTGHNPICIDGVGTTAACNAGGGAPYASAGMASDMNTLDKTVAAHFASVTKNAITTNFPGALYAGITTWGTYVTPPNRWVIEGMAPYVDIMQTGGNGEFTQAELDFVHTYTSAVGAGDLAISYGSYRTSNADSPFEWPNTSCTRSGTTVTCTLATPQNFSTGLLIDTACADPTYNVVQVYPTAVGSSSLTYAAIQTPANGSTTCNVQFDDSGEGFSTQNARATAVANQLQYLPNWFYSADGIHPYVMAIWWQWSDKESEKLSWGLVDTRDNAYNGIETTISTLPCSAPLQSFNCGGELRTGWGSTDGITPLINANAAIDAALSTLGSTLPTINGAVKISGPVKQ